MFPAKEALLSNNQGHLFNINLITIGVIDLKQLRIEEL